MIDAQTLGFKPGPAAGHAAAKRTPRSANPVRLTQGQTVARGLRELIATNASGAIYTVRARLRVLPPDAAWLRLQELHLKAIGFPGPLTTSTAASLNDKSAFGAYSKALCCAIAQVLVIGPNGRANIAKSIARFASCRGTFAGLEGVFLSAVLGIQLATNKPALMECVLVWRQLGLPTVLGGGALTSPVIDPGTGRGVLLSPDQLLTLGTTSIPGLNDADPDEAFFSGLKGFLDGFGARGPSGALNPLGKGGWADADSELGSFCANAIQIAGGVGTTVGGYIGGGLGFMYGTVAGAPFLGTGIGAVGGGGAGEVGGVIVGTLICAGAAVVAGVEALGDSIPMLEPPKESSEKSTGKKDANTQNQSQDPSTLQSVPQPTNTENQSKDPICPNPGQGMPTPDGDGGNDGGTAVPTVAPVGNGLKGLITFAPGGRFNLAGMPTFDDDRKTITSGIMPRVINPADEGHQEGAPSDPGPGTSLRLPTHLYAPVDPAISALGEILKGLGTTLAKSK